MCNFSIVLYRSIWKILSPFQRMSLNFCIYFHSFIYTTCIFHSLESNLLFIFILMLKIFKVLFSAKEWKYTWLQFSLTSKFSLPFCHFLLFFFFLLYFHPFFPFVFWKFITPFVFSNCHISFNSMLGSLWMLD